MSKVAEIAERWADCRWPRIGYFVHGQARSDINDLLGEVGRLRSALVRIASAHPADGTGNCARKALYQEE